MGCCSAEKGLCQSRDLLELRRRGYELPRFHVDDHAQVLANEDGVEVSFRWVNLEAQPREQGEGVNLQFQCLVVGRLEQCEVVDERKEAGSSEPATASTPSF